MNCNHLHLILILSLSSFGVSANVLKLIYEKGSVTITRSNKVIKTKDIFPADKITTGQNSLAILKGERETLKIQADSELIYQHGATTEDSTVVLNLGSIISQLYKKKFQVKTKGVSMGVRGTQFFTSLNSNDEILMAVNEGTVEVNDGHSTTLVGAGLGLSVINGITSKAQAFTWLKNLNWNMDPSQVLDEQKIILRHLEDHKAIPSKSTPPTPEEKSIYDD